MVAIYGAAVWAYIGVLIAYRGFYAIGDRIAPVRISTGIVVCNLVLNAVLVCTIGGIGLAIGGAVSAAVQAVAAMLLLQSRVGRLEWSGIATTVIKTLVATIAMTAVCVILQSILPSGTSLAEKGAAVAFPILAGIAVFLVAAWLLKLREPWDLLSSKWSMAGGR
jgi:putative peptidoglycan lipid II flippase